MKNTDSNTGYLFYSAIGLIAVFLIRRVFLAL